jgi:hypothetical protein
MMTFCGACNKWVQASSIAQPFGTPYVCGHADGAVALEAPQQELGTWTTLVHRPAGYGARYILTEAEALGQAIPTPRQEESHAPVYLRQQETLEARGDVRGGSDHVASQTPTPPETSVPAATLIEPPPIDADLVRCRSCQKGYRWPMEASRTDEHHLCLRCEYKANI